MFGIKKGLSQRDSLIYFKRTFGSVEGKHVLYSLMSRYYVLNPHKGDLYSEGQRSVVLDILKRCNVSLEQFDEMLKGNNSV